MKSKSWEELEWILIAWKAIHNWKCIQHRGQNKVELLSLKHHRLEYNKKARHVELYKS